MRSLISGLLCLGIVVLPTAEAEVWLALTGPGVLKNVLLALSVLACPVLMVLFALGIGRLLDREDRLLTCWRPVVFGMPLVLLTHVALNDHRLAQHGRTEQVTIVSRSVDVHDGGSGDNPTNYVTYRYKVIGPRGDPIRGRVDSSDKLPVGRRLLATYDPGGRADPRFGRPGNGWLIWVLPLLELVVIGCAIRVLLPDEKIRAGPPRPGPDRPPGLSRADRVRWQHDRFGY